MIFRGFPSFNLIAVNSFTPWCFGAVQLVTVGAGHLPRRKPVTRQQPVL